MNFRDLYMLNEGWGTSTKLYIVIDSKLAAEISAEDAAFRYAAYKVLWFNENTVSLYNDKAFR